LTWTVTYTLTARGAIRRLDPGTRNRIRVAVEDLASDPLRGKPLGFTLRGLLS
jgi:hypothetical protein